jgi:hypothetical protein
MYSLNVNLGQKRIIMLILGGVVKLWIGSSSACTSTHAWSINAFTVVSVYATSWESGDTVIFNAYRGADMVGTLTNPITTSNPTFINIFPNNPGNTFTDITSITFIASPGNSGGDKGWVILDNLVVYDCRA